MNKIPGEKNRGIEMVRRERAKDPYYREGDRPVDTLKRHVVVMREIFEDPNYGYGAGVLADTDSEYMNLLNRLEDELKKLDSAKS